MCKGPGVGVSSIFFFFLGTSELVRQRAKGSWVLEQGDLRGSAVQSEGQQAGTGPCGVIVTSCLIVTEALRRRC